MNDPRLNSMHLESPRREDFRRAREALLESRGLQTIAGERLLGAPQAEGSHTMIQAAPDHVPASSDYWLIADDAIFPLKIGVNTIGRLPDNDVVIQGPYVSRRHCAILIHVGDACELYDIASKNGTYVNGARLSGPTRLSCGDKIRMCDRQFVFMSKKGPKQGLAYDNTRAE
jgi:hypothetical protein